MQLILVKFRFNKLFRFSNSDVVHKPMMSSCPIISVVTYT